MNTLSNFSQFALTRSEMRAVIGGCGRKCNGTWTYGWTKAEAKGSVGSNGCTNWCCESC
jgi:natural product precursor